jgi:twitching motility protein PilI
VGADNWFVALHQVSEVIPVPALVQVPRTQPWFRGVVNVRGNLYSMVDFAAFQGGDATSSAMERRVILVSERLVAGAGLLVSRMLGLRNPEHSRPCSPSRPLLGGRRVLDAGGTRWLELPARSCASSDSSK